ncbi:papain family cysteine protease (macronuclear) [Tetrahymena thermophila SB210]|uniref:cathepsin L n=1 Tax=Tetrahymena thermophila (strain SB210) TaxID=312017 RepID=Q24E33_TETTS|nr:papain family cysteine protease [Tetrahymena thermophila SB210]EAS06068.1 papain family cysteine protease [Tetrahymena thermophila SB210]|eukprot:XP_001026313.1 papain family cysteine protease [Tetrahymena thermophila SB210]
MNKIITSVLLLGLFAFSSYMVANKSSSTTLLRSSNNDLAEMYAEFKLEHNIVFQNSEEDLYRQNIFFQNVRYIQSENAKNNTFKLAINIMAILTDEEYSSLYLNLDQQESIDIFDSLVDDNETVGDIPSEVNWTAQGAVTPVKNQGSCGSCWAFSTTGALEGSYFLKNNQLISFSEQQLVDCSRLYLNMGCNGGLMPRAFRYVKAHGITTEEEYPYTAKDGKCQTKQGQYKIKSFSTVPRGNCDKLAAAIAQQPVSVGVDATNFKFYTSGVFDNCKKKLNHGVLATGYTADYWIIKNSWGTAWGQNGYINLKRGNTCGVCNTASYPHF